MPLSPEKSTGIAVAFIGAIVPDRPAYRSAAFNRAGNTFQTELIRGLARSGFPDIEVFSARPVPAYPRSQRLFYPASQDRLGGGIAIRFLPFPNVTPLKQVVLGLDTLFYLLTWSWRKRKQRRIVLSYNLSVPPAAFTLVAARLARAKAVVSVNDVNIPGETVPNSTWFRFDFALQRFLMPKFDGHLTVADAIAEDFFPGRAYVRIDGGVDAGFLERTRRLGSAARPPSPLVLAFAGTLNTANGIPLIINALKLIPDQKLQLKIAGAGPLQSMVEEAQRLDPRIEYLGMRDPAGVADLYTQADVLLNVRLTADLNTRYFFPSKLIEYLGSGVLTITTRVAHAETEFGDFACVLAQESPQALADLVTLIASWTPMDRSEFGIRARSYVSQYKTWDVQAAKVAEYLGTLIGT